ncbi:MAG: hypothetical protein M3295_06190, partial [Chloroflexota bacterium]|nr:hypothetical protein [Chloroflexota bacterium]
TTAETLARSEAALLFVERAMAVDPGFRLTDDNAAAIADITARLDGLPLAIELAAARVRTLPVEALRQRLDRSLRTLTGGARDLPARQQTLRGAIDWSHDLLDEPDRRLFARFAVFEGGASLAEIEAVCGPEDEIGRDLLDGLASLADKSLLRRVPSATDDARFAMLATIREYAMERLDASRESDELRRRHAAAYAALVERVAPDIGGAQGTAPVDRLDLDHDNVRAALDWAEAVPAPDVALRITAAIWRFWQYGGHLAEASQRVSRILAMPADDVPPTTRARAFIAGGSVAYWRGEWPQAHAWYRNAVERARESGDEALLAEALYNFGYVPDPTEFSEAERYRRGRRHFEESRTLFEHLADRRGVASTTWALALALIADGELEAARELTLDGVAIARELDDPFGLASALHLIAVIGVNTERFDEAIDAIREAVTVSRRIGDKTGLLIGVVDGALLERARGRQVEAYRLFAASTALRSLLGADLLSQSGSILEWDLPKEPPSDPDLRRAWDEGLELSLDEALALTPGVEPGGAP